MGAVEPVEPAEQVAQVAEALVAKRRATYTRLADIPESQRSQVGILQMRLEDGTAFQTVSVRGQRQGPAGVGGAALDARDGGVAVKHNLPHARRHHHLSHPVHTIQPCFGSGLGWGLWLGLGSGIRRLLPLMWPGRPVAPELGGRPAGLRSPVASSERTDSSWGLSDRPPPHGILPRMWVADSSRPVF